MNNKKRLPVYTIIISLAILFSCGKDSAPNAPPQPQPVPETISFHESFDSAGNLTAKGWSFKNNSLPVGMNGWRQGRYDPVVYGSTPGKLGANPPIPFIGFPAYKASTSPHDFISCDAACVGFEGGVINAWLISPKKPIKNGDVIEFYTRAMNDLQLAVFIKDRLQVRANFTDSTDDVGNNESSVGSFTTLLLDMNPNYINDDDGGYPNREWTKVTITISGLIGPVVNARFAFRYMGEDAGANGPVYAGVVGIDELTFTSK